MNKIKTILKIKPEDNEETLRNELELLRLWLNEDGYKINLLSISNGLNKIIYSIEPELETESDKKLFDSLVKIRQKMQVTISDSVIYTKEQLQVQINEFVDDLFNSHLEYIKYIKGDDK